MQVHPAGEIIVPIAQVGNPVRKWFDVTDREVLYLVLLAGTGCFVIFIIIFIFLIYMQIIPKF